MYAHTRTRTHTSVCVCVSTDLSIYLVIYVSIYLSLSAYPYVQPSTHPSIHPHIHTHTQTHTDTHRDTQAHKPSTCPSTSCSTPAFHAPTTGTGASFPRGDRGEDGELTLSPLIIDAPSPTILGDVAWDAGNIGRDVGEVGLDNRLCPLRCTLPGCPMTPRRMPARRWRPCHRGTLSAPVSVLRLRALRTVGASVPCIITARVCGSGCICMCMCMCMCM